MISFFYMKKDIQKKIPVCVPHVSHFKNTVEFLRRSAKVSYRKNLKYLKKLQIFKKIISAKNSNAKDTVGVSWFLYSF